MNNYAILVIFLIFFNIFFIILLSKVAKLINLIDYPDNRKNHYGNIPLIGGLAIYLSISLLMLFNFSFDRNILIIYFASFIILIMGILDDKYTLGVKTRLFIQFFSTLVVIGSGTQIFDLGEYNLINTLELKIFGIFFTVVCVMAYTNAINFVDGIDGLASGLLIVSLLSILLFSYINNHNENLLIVHFFIVSLTIFFIANHGIIFSKIFLGDSGSMSIGFLVAFLAIYYTQSNNNFFHPVLVIWIVFLPILNLSFVTFYRITNSQSLFLPNKIHLHDVLINNGFSIKSTKIIFILSSLILNILGLILFNFFGSDLNIIFFLVIFSCSFFYFRKIQKKLINSDKYN